MLKALLYTRLLLLSASVFVGAEPSRLCAQMTMEVSPSVAQRSTPDKELKRLTKTLKLTEQQRAQILPLLEERSKAINTLFGDQEAPMRDKFPKILEITDSSNATVWLLLTEPQQRKFDKIVADQKRRREAGPDEDPPSDMPPPPPL